jgi:hypothetical protein
MTVTITKINESGFPSIPGDEYLGLTPEEQESFFPSIVQNQPFFIDCLVQSFILQDEEILFKNIQSVNVTFPDYQSLELEIIDDNPLNYVVRIIGNLENLFPGEIFQFLMKNRTIKILPVDSEENWLSIVRWGIPPIRKIILTYNFSIIDEENQQTNITFQQNAYWRFDQSLIDFQQVLAKSKL